jgi:hypothetical protein
MPHHQFIEEPPQRSQMQLPSRRGHHHGIQISDPHPPEPLEPDPAAVLRTPTREPFHRMQVRLSSEPIANLPMQKLLKRKPRRSTRIPNQRRQIRILPLHQLCARSMANRSPTSPAIHLPEHSIKQPPHSSSVAKFIKNSLFCQDNHLTADPISFTANHAPNSLTRQPPESSRHPMSFSSTRP